MQAELFTVRLDRVEFSESGIRQLPNLTPGEYCQLLVTDTGEGMNPERMERIFEPFFTTKEVGQGDWTGIVRGAWNCPKPRRGKLELPSTPDKGTEFRVYLPLVEEACSSGKD